MISVEEKRAAYEEARQLLLLGKKWQQLMPGERKPDFKRAAKAVIRRALGKSTVPREPDPVSYTHLTLPTSDLV